MQLEASDRVQREEVAIQLTGKYQIAGRGDHTPYEAPRFFSISGLGGTGAMRIS